MMQQDKILTRQLINPCLMVHDLDSYTHDIVKSYNYVEFCQIIDRWKCFLIEQHNVKSGQTVMVELAGDAVYHAFLFAAWELGLILIVDWPHAKSEEDLTNYRYVIHGRPDFAIFDHNQVIDWDMERTQRFCNVLIDIKEFTDYIPTNEQLLGQMANLVCATNQTPAIWSASGGTTGLPTKVSIDHEFLLLSTKRLAIGNKFEMNSSSLHNMNLHHGASACYHFLPSYLHGADQYISTVSHKNMPNVANCVVKHKINNVFLVTTLHLMEFLETTPPVNHELNLTTLFKINVDAVKLIKEKGINSIRGQFGDTTIGYGFFIKMVTLNTPVEGYKPYSVGKPFDDFFEFSIRDGFLYVAIPSMGIEAKTSKDKFELNPDTGFYYFHGRGNKYRIGEEWIELSELDSAVDKIFGSDRATAVVDQEESKLYLATWGEPSEVKEKLFGQWLDKKYNIKLNAVARNLDSGAYNIGRKIDRSRLRDYFRRTAVK